MSKQTIPFVVRVATRRYTLCLLLLLWQPVMASNWLQTAPGIEYQDLNTNQLTNWSHIHVFRIDLKQNKLELVMSPLPKRRTTVAEFARQGQAMIALNGGFFDEHDQPLGLRISQQQLYNPLKLISWWGIFYIQNGQPHIANIRSYKKNHANIDFAIQSGPRLLIKGKILPLKIGFAERSALGITDDNHVIILVTENTPMTTTALAQLLQAAPLHCTDAINLDGGSSSQLYAHMGELTIDAPGLSAVTDAIVVKARHA